MINNRKVVTYSVFMDVSFFSKRKRM